MVQLPTIGCENHWWGRGGGGFFKVGYVLMSRLGKKKGTVEFLSKKLYLYAFEAARRRIPIQLCGTKTTLNSENNVGFAFHKNCVFSPRNAKFFITR